MKTATTPTMTLGRLARESGLVRASLLHYEKLGLLKPRQRSASGYRLYGADELERLRSIRRFREAGLSLRAICDLLKPPSAVEHRTSQSAQILEQRLSDLCAEMEHLRKQQKQLARLLASPAFRSGRQAGSKAAWVAMLRKAGLSDAEMHNWHQCFETDSPREHAAFLRSLGLQEAEIARIRRWSRRPFAE